MFDCFCFSSRSSKKHNTITKNSSHYISITKILKQQQIELLELIYEDLASRSIQKLVSYQIFLSFFDLRGLWGSKLFRQFDQSGKQLITGQQFLYGICMTIQAPINEKVKLIYNFFEGNITDGITYKQFIKMLYNYSKPQLKQILLEEGVFIDQIGIIPVNTQNLSKHLHRKIQLNYEHPPTDSTNLSSFEEAYKDLISQYKDPGTSLQIKTNDVTYQIKYCNMISLVRDFAKFVFKKYNLDENGKLSFDQFKEWTSIHMRLFQSYFNAFHQDIWQCQMGKIPKYLESNKIEKQFQGKFDYKNNIQEVCVLLVDGVLIICKNPRTKQSPLKIICLSGLTVTRVYDINGYGMVIKHTDDHYQPSILYFQNQKKQQQWLNCLSIYGSDLLLRNYMIGEAIGTGKFSVVYKCKEKVTGKQFALKVINKKKLPQEAITAISNERHVMEILNHPQIVNFKQTILTKNDINILIEYVEGQDLFEFVRKYGTFEQHLCAFVIGHIIKAVMHLHSLDIIHRDLKPENIMVMYSKKKQNEVMRQQGQQRQQKESTQISIQRRSLYRVRTKKSQYKKAPPISNVKIIDFGLANHISQLNLLSSQKIAVGTPNYIAPQILLSEKISFKADNFAIGSIMYFILRGKLTFNAHTSDQTLIKTVKGDYNFEDSFWKQISDQAKDLIQRLLQVQPTKRIQLEDALNHPWFKKVSQPKLKQVHHLQINNTKRSSSLNKLKIQTLKKYKSEIEQLTIKSNKQIVTLQIQQ